MRHEQRDQLRVVVGSRPFPHHRDGGLRTAAPVENVDVLSQPKQPGVHADLPALQPEHAALTVPVLVTLPQCLADLIAQIEDAADAERDVTADCRGLLAQPDQFRGPAQRCFASTDGAAQIPHRHQRPGHVQREHAGPKRDVVLEESGQRRRIQHASRAAQQRHVVGVTQRVVIEPRLSAQPHRQQSSPQAVLQRLPGRQVRRQRKTPDDLSEPQRRWRRHQISPLHAHPTSQRPDCNRTRSATRHVSSADSTPWKPHVSH